MKLNSVDIAVQLAGINNKLFSEQTYVLPQASAEVDNSTKEMELSY